MENEAFELVNQGKKQSGSFWLESEKQFYGKKLNFFSKKLTLLEIIVI